MQVGDIHLPEWEDDTLPLDIKDNDFSRDITSDLRLGRMRSILRRLNEVATSGGIDCIAVMGDLTTYGKQDHVVPAMDILKNLFTREDGTHPPIACVPGNHDVDRHDALTVGKFGKFTKLAEQARLMKWLPIPVDNIVQTTLKSDDQEIDLVMLNSSIGSWSPHLLPAGLSEQFGEGSLALPPITGSELADVIPDGKQTPDASSDRIQQLYKQLDTPYISSQSLTSLSQAISNSPRMGMVIVAHHNILPQRTPRILAYGELLNGGYLRQLLLDSGKKFIYLHGHIHEDPVEIVTAPSHAHSRYSGCIVSISAPRIEEGFNEVTVFVTEQGDPFLVRITKFRPNASGVIGAFADQQSLLIPIGLDPTDLFTAEVRMIWQALKEKKIMNWREIIQLTQRNPIGEDALEDCIMRLLAAGMVTVSHFGRERNRWTVESRRDAN